MVKTTIIIFMGISSFLSVKSQIKDSVICDKYFEWLASEDAQLITLWSQAPQLKGTNMPLLYELCDLVVCDLVVCDTCRRMIVTLILDKSGHVMCFKTYPELDQSSLSDKIIKLLYGLEFIPAMQYKTPVISHFGLAISTQKCEFYRSINLQKKKWRKIFPL